MDCLQKIKSMVLPGVGASVSAVVSLTEVVVGSSGLSVVGPGVVIAGVVGDGVVAGSVGKIKTKHVGFHHCL